MQPLRLLLTAASVRARRALDARMNRRAARRRPYGKMATRFMRHPPPRVIGSYARGQAMLDGRVVLDDFRVDVSPAAFWSAAAPSEVFFDAQHGFDWIDDLAAIGTKPARERAQGWMLAWMRTARGGRGPGWRPDLAGRRLLRLATYGRFLTRRLAPEDKALIFETMAGHITYLLYVWHTAPTPLARLDALTGLAHAAFALEGGERHLPAIQRGLGREASEVFDEDGGQVERNPELAMECFARLVWCARILEAAGTPPDPRHLEAIRRAAPVMRTLRLGDGSLARFNGGGAGKPGMLDQALAESGERAPAASERVMGFARLTGGRLALVMDADAPPRGSASAHAHAGTLSFELTSGRRRMIVNCGPGLRFGEDWGRASRATGSHSTLAMDRTSSARVAEGGYVTDVFGEWLVDGPRHVTFDRDRDAGGAWMVASHDGYFATHGLIHERRLYISTLGTELQGEDSIRAEGEEARAIFARRFSSIARLGAPFAIHFHLHPSVALRPDNEAGGQRLILQSGENWLFRQSGADLSVADSVWFDAQAQRPVPCKQLVLAGRIRGHGASVSWALSRELIGGHATRDLAVDEMAAGGG